MGKIVYLFLTWRFFLFVILIFGTAVLPLQIRFLGGGSLNYIQAPYLWSWSNFDGVHYLNIAQNGYGSGEQAFFPLYPQTLKYLSVFFGKSPFIFNFIGLWVSNLSFFIAIYGLVKLIRIDYEKNFTNLVLLLLLLFPTSFYFGSVYTESTFLALVVWSFYFARKNRWFLASFLGALASATRVLGILLLPALFVEAWYGQKKRKVRQLWPIFIISFGLLYYMYYLYINYGDPLKFIHVLPTFGEQRQILPVTLPQVFYRYIIKILPNVSYHYFPNVFTTYLEFLTGLIFFILVILSFFKTRLSYAVFALFAYMVPSLSGSFSSLPRYVLVIFPAFLVMAKYLIKLPKIYTRTVLAFLALGLIVATALFTRGFWVS